MPACSVIEINQTIPLTDDPADDCSRVSLSHITIIYPIHEKAFVQFVGTEKWQLVASRGKLFCFIRMDKFLLSILASLDFAMFEFSPFPAKCKHRFACRRSNKWGAPKVQEGKRADLLNFHPK